MGHLPYLDIVKFISPNMVAIAVAALSSQCGYKHVTVPVALYQVNGEVVKPAKSFARVQKFGVKRLGGVNHSSN